MLIICFAKCTFYEKIKTKKVNKGLTNCFCFFCVTFYIYSYSEIKVFLLLVSNAKRNAI